MNRKIYPVILSGGSGSRLWPLSREKSPKQFIPLLNDKNLLQNTCMRFHDKDLFHAPVIVCNEDHRFQVAESLRNLELNAGAIILEPCARNTAPAITLAALAVMEEDEGGVMLVSPSDHYISNFSEITDIMQSFNVEDDWLYAFGIKPESAKIGYKLRQEKSTGKCVH
ncbi:sugar phosphate nucleotidyltransferase [Facilibium subflavum]|uniref:sugar phosphate nucleotidyltransferase n=1 Tax=Facilibium subflavum TaxID=2219058 RepID=UPI0013C303C2|nr:sugar phosphate nucleotidyltransferase [Facilibium subflavum]